MQVSSGILSISLWDLGFRELGQKTHAGILIPAVPMKVHGSDLGVSGLLPASMKSADMVAFK